MKNLPFSGSGVSKWSLRNPAQLAFASSDRSMGIPSSWIMIIPKNYITMTPIESLNIKKTHHESCIHQWSHHAFHGNLKDPTVTPPWPRSKNHPHLQGPWRPPSRISGMFSWQNISWSSSATQETLEALCHAMVNLWSRFMAILTDNLK